MNIQWTIAKARGNQRPVLSYTTSLSDFEKTLAVPAVRIESSIPKPPDSGWGHCWPGENERGPWTPVEHHLLMTPSHRTGSLTERLRLPWREDNAYPEVEASFQALRQAFETALAQAVASSPMQQTGSLETTPAARQAIAPAFMAQRILRAVGE